jgi:hypothetical protein
LSRRRRSNPGDDPNACADVAIYGVRGAFEPFNDDCGGMGSTLFSVAERTESTLAASGASLRIDFVGVAYPANTWLYLWSRHRGKRNLADLLAEDVARCAQQRIVLIGLSQGAEVLRRTLSSLDAEVTKRVTAIVLLGDPTRHPGDPWTHGTTDSHPGVAVRYAVPVPAELRASTWGFALDGDEIAANHTGLRGLFRSGTHTLYEHDHDQVLSQAASFISERLQSDRS